MKKTILFMTLAISLMSCVKNTPGKHLQIGEEMPVFSAMLDGGGSVSNESLSGKPSLLMFFSPTCYDCREELPEIEELYKALGEHMAFVAISRNGEIELVRQLWNTCGYTIPVAIPDSYALYNLFDRGSFSGVPQIFVFDSAGELRYYYDDVRFVPYSAFVNDFIPALMTISGNTVVF